jgi:phosphocarrier protein
MMKKEVTIINKLGLHARAAAKFVTVASGYESEVEVVHGNRRVNGKSIMGVMMLAASKGKTLELIATGGDEEQAINGLENLVRDRFGEAE